MRVIALDPGTVRIGVALSDPLGITAQPHSSLDATAADVVDQIVALVAETGAERVIVGLPVSLDGREGNAAETARDFAERVSGAIDVPVEMVDERFSSVTAERVMLEAGARRSERRRSRDRVAAAVFLQSYLDGGR